MSHADKDCECEGQTNQQDLRHSQQHCSGWEVNVKNADHGFKWTSLVFGTAAVTAAAVILAVVTAFRYGGVVQYDPEKVHTIQVLESLLKQFLRCVSLAHDQQHTV